MRLKIMLVDDHAMIREGLHALIGDQPDMEVVGEAGNGRDGVEKAEQLQPDLIIMDINMPDMNGIEATRLIKASHPNIKVVAQSAFSESCFGDVMMKAGASAYVSKDKLFEELVQTIRSVAQLPPPCVSAVEWGP